MQLNLTVMEQAAVASRLSLTGKKEEHDERLHAAYPRKKHQIHALMKAGHNQTEIANVLGRHKSTIGRELARNRGLRGYRPKPAHWLSVQRRQDKARPRICCTGWSRIEHLLREDWSSKQISLWLKKQDGIVISHEWIYQYVLQDKRQGGDLYRHLRCQKARRKRYGTYEHRGRLPDRVSIDKRPAVVERRSRRGDWELDTIIGKEHKGALVSLCERKSRLALIAKVPTEMAEGITQAVVGLLKPLADRVHTLTSDNGKEFSKHTAVAKALNARFYFAHPYASWERGLNENTNGLIRQHFSKSRDFITISDEAIRMVMNKLNNRPRKCLGMKKTNQVFFRINPAVVLTT